LEDPVPGRYTKEERLRIKLPGDTVKYLYKPGL